jgi:hypothetical protein
VQAATRSFTDISACPKPLLAHDLYGAFPVKSVVLGLSDSSLFGAGRPFFVPSPAIRFPERAEGVKGPKR